MAKFAQEINVKQSVSQTPSAAQDKLAEEASASVAAQQTVIARLPFCASVENVKMHAQSLAVPTRIALKVLVAETSAVAPKALLVSQQLSKAASESLRLVLKSVFKESDVTRVTACPTATITPNAPEESNVSMACASSSATLTRIAYKERSASTNFVILVVDLMLIANLVSNASMGNALAKLDTSRPHLDAKTLTNVRTMSAQFQ